MEMTTKIPTEIGAYWCVDIRCDNKPFVQMVRMYRGVLSIGNYPLSVGNKYEYWSGKIEDAEMPEVAKEFNK